MRLSSKSPCRGGLFGHYVNMKILAGFARSLSSLFGRKDAKSVSKSRLLGLYLNQANGKDGPTSEFHQTRQRRNGKYSHNRERA